MNQTVIYRLDRDNVQHGNITIDPSFSVEIWTPSFSRVIPPGKPPKYIIYWFFHYLRIFKNRHYSAVLMKLDDKTVSSLLVVPAHFKWPFMQRQDVQFTYVMTDEKYRGKFLAGFAIQHYLNNFIDKTSSYWYVTDKNNFPSVRLCEKMGFKIEGNGLKRGLMRILRLNAYYRQMQ